MPLVYRFRPNGQLLRLINRRDNDGHLMLSGVTDEKLFGFLLPLILQAINSRDLRLVHDTLKGGALMDRGEVSEAC